MFFFNGSKRQSTLYDLKSRFKIYTQFFKCFDIPTNKQNQSVIHICSVQKVVLDAGFKLFFTYFEAENSPCTKHMFNLRFILSDYAKTNLSLKYKIYIFRIIQGLLMDELLELYTYNIQYM